MRFASVLVITLLFGYGCGGTRHGGWRVEAQRFERGDGVPRDYTRAVRIYEASCNQNQDNLEACRKFALAVLLNRGEPVARRDLRALLTRGCERGDWLSCIEPYASFDIDKATAACKAGAPAACLLVASTHRFSQSGTVEDADHDRLEQACNGEVLEACEHLVANTRNPSTAASTRVQRACDDGDADACEALGHPVAPTDLCRANDFSACAKTTDTSDLDRGCDRGIVEACEKLAIAARDADPPDPKAAARFARACEVGSSMCNKGHPDDVAIGCDAYRPTRVPASRRVKLPPLTGMDTQGAPWSTPIGRPFLIIGLESTIPSESYADVARRLSPDIGVYVTTATQTTPALFAPAKVITLDATSASTHAAAADTPDPGDPMQRPLGEGRPTVVDRTFMPRAVLSLQNGIVPVSFARCVRALLALP